MRIIIKPKQTRLRALDKKEVNKDFTLRELLAIIKVGLKAPNTATVKRSPIKSEVYDSSNKLIGSLDNKGNLLIDDAIYSRYRSILKNKKDETNQLMAQVTENEFPVEQVALTQEEKDEIDNSRRGASTDKARRVFVDKHGDREIRLEGGHSIDKDMFAELIKTTYGRAFNKFGEILAKWSLDGTIDDRRPEQKQRFMAALDLLVEAHEEEYDDNFNGLKPDDIIRLFANEVKAQTAKERAASESVEETESEYTIVPVKSQDEARKFYKYINIDGSSSSSQWCVVRGSYDNYVNEDGAELFYFMLREGFDKYTREPEPGPTAPFDEFGMSMIAVSVDSNGMLKTATTRWNHTQGGNDRSFTESQLAELAGGPFRKKFPALTDPDQRERDILMRAYPIVKSGTKSILIDKEKFYLSEDKKIIRDPYGIPYAFTNYTAIATMDNGKMIRKGYVIFNTQNSHYVITDTELDIIVNSDDLDDTGEKLSRQKIIGIAKEVLQ